jgi:hypothetical protein
VKLIARLLLCGPVLGLAIPSVQAQNPQEKPFLCTLRHEAPPHPPTLYMTGVFYSRTAAGPNVAWEKYIRETYRIPANDFAATQCRLLHPTQREQQYSVTLVEQQAKANKQDVIHVDWRYTPD